MECGQGPNADAWRVGWALGGLREQVLPPEIEQVPPGSILVLMPALPTGQSWTRGGAGGGVSQKRGLLRCSKNQTGKINS